MHKSALRVQQRIVLAQQHLLHMVHFLHVLGILSLLVDVLGNLAQLLGC